MIQINDTTYGIPGLGDRLTPPVITLGGKDPKKFAPNLNIGYSFGGGEEYFDNLNRSDKIITGKSEIKHDGKKVRLIEGSDIDEIYTDDLGRVKWDVVFEKCPESFVLEWRRTCSPGLTAYYQDALTEEEIREGAHRPDDVIGSYAIYCDKAHNWIRPLNRKHEIPADWREQRAAGAELADLNIAAYRDYKNGKVGHRYRPFVVDVDGKMAWCSLLIIGAVEYVTLPKAFMLSAKYPVRLDPTLGNSTVGASTNTVTDVMRLMKFTASVAGTCNPGTAYVYGSPYPNDNVLLGLYADSSGAPGSKLSSSENAITLTTEGGGWNSVSITVSGGIAASTAYWIGLLGEGVGLYYDIISGSGHGYVLQSYSSGLPDPAGTMTSSTRQYTGYIEYTESGGGHPTASRFRDMHRNNNVRYA